MNEFDNELLHYAKGQTKKNAKYKSRKMVNGRWYYDYGDGVKSNIQSAKNFTKWANASREAEKELGKITIDYSDPNYQEKYTKDFKAWESQRNFTKEMHRRSNKAYSTAESLKRQQVSGLGALQRASERNEQIKAAESAKRMQQSSLAAKQRAEEKTVKYAVSKYARKGKALIDKLLSKI